ncbi:hypothetical protein KI688_005777 [Linnemannia hyalina]|uniref:Uncharacterized protein n=1 Tax=Linnemannia hyalina TaxID=64524 RepID=A0A9P7Y252_9FUNG|nr:hypothetical protein KI688_005777 [Linnemannia hyalina]
MMLSPSAGSGAINSILDAVTLANWIVCLRPFSALDEASRELEAFQSERLPWVKASFELSKVLKNMLARNLKAKIIRTVSKIGSQSLTQRNLIKMTQNQP